jgi:hypothetical protein
MSSISTLSFDLQSVAPMFFGAPVFEKKKSDETHEQLEERVWRDKVRQNADGHVYIQPFALKNALEAAGSRLNMKLTGKATYTKLFRQGIVINDEIVLHDRSGKPVTIEAIRPIPMFVPSQMENVEAANELCVSFHRFWNGLLRLKLCVLISD